MSEFTRDIQLLQRQQQMQSGMLQTNTGSLAGDVASAAMFSFNTFRNLQAQEAVGEARVQQAEYSTRVNEGILKMREWRQLQKDTGNTGNSFRRGEAKELKSLGDSNFQMDVIGGLNKLTKLTSGEVMDEITATAVKEDKRQQDLKVQRQEREVNVVTAAGISGFAIGDVTQMTEDELNRIELAGAQQQAENTYNLSVLQKQRNALQDKGAQQNMDSKIWASQTGTELGGIASAALGTFIKENGGISAQNAPLAVEELNNYKSQIRGIVLSKARDSATYVSPEAIESMVSSLEQGVERTKTLFTKEDSVKALTSNMDALYLGGLSKMFGSSVKEERDAVNTLYSSKFVGLPTEMGSFNVALEFVSNTLQGNVDPAKEGFSDVLRNLPNIMTSNGTIEVEHQESNQKIIDGLLNNSPDKVKEAVKKGALDSITKAIKAQGVGVISPEKAAETADMLYKAAVPSLAGNIQRLMMQETSNNPTTNEFGSMGTSQDIRDNYTLDMATMQFKRTGRIAGRNAQIDQVNLLIKNTRDAFITMGMDSTYVKGFDEDILLTLGMAPTKD